MSSQVRVRLHQLPGPCSRGLRLAGSGSVRRWTGAHRVPPGCRARAGGEPEQEPKQQRVDTDLALIAVALGLTTVAGAAVTFGQDELLDFLYGSYDGAGDASDLPFTGGDVAGAALWSTALWFCSPLQVLLLFFGFFERERPSDWFLQLMGRAAGLRVDEVDYEAPAYLRAATLALVVAGGVGTSAVLELGLGDATWSVSSGIGMCLAAGVYELGRPERLSRDKAVELEGQWREFAKFGDAQLVRKGRCHESEVFAAFRRQHARYRQPDTLPDATLRDMVRNWHPDVERTRTGYLKNLSLRPRVDPFTGQVSGSVDTAVAAAVMMSEGAGADAGDAAGAEGSVE